MTVPRVYRIKLKDYDIRVLIGVLYEYHLQMKQRGMQTNKADAMLLQLLDDYEKHKVRKYAKRALTKKR